MISMLIIEDKLISLELFERKFSCAVEKCKGACCVKGDFGAPLEEDEITQLRSHLPVLLPKLSEEAREKIAQTDVAEWYEEMEAYGTTLLENGTCVFAKIGENGIASCTIQEAYYENLIDFNKPVSCHLYPIRVSENKELNFTALNYDEWDICNPACTKGEELGIKVYQFAKDALIRKFGADFFQALEDADQELNR